MAEIAEINEPTRLSADGLSKAHYSPPWADMSIIGIAGSSGSGKTSLAVEVVKSLDLPWVIIMSIDSFYNSLTPEENALAHANEFDLDSPKSIDFDLLYRCLYDLKQGPESDSFDEPAPPCSALQAPAYDCYVWPRYEYGHALRLRKRTDIPVYSFAKHQRLEETVSIYSPHVIVLEGILALNDPRVADMLDLKVYMEADADVCLSRRIVRDVRERGRTIEGTIKQWFTSVKPAFVKYVEPQREVADLIVPRGMMNKMAITMIVGQTRQILKDKSVRHRAELERLGKGVEDQPLSENVIFLDEKPQINAIMTLLRNEATTPTEYAFYADRLAALLVEKALDCHNFLPNKVVTPQKTEYNGLKSAGKVSAIVILRGGGCMESGLKRTIPDCLTGRLLIQSNLRTGEPELHYMKLLPDIAEHETVMLLDPQMSSGGAALMAVKVLVDHGVSEKKIVFVTFIAGKRGVNRLTSVFPGVKVVAGEIGDDHQRRWIEEKYFGC